MISLPGDNVITNAVEDAIDLIYQATTHAINHGVDFETDLAKLDTVVYNLQSDIEWLENLIAKARDDIKHNEMHSKSRGWV